MGLATDGPLPEVWSAASANVRWRTDLPGAGNSSPIVARGRVFLTTSHDAPDAEEGTPARRSCLAVDFATGEILWETPVVTTPYEARHRFSTGAGPTPATDGEHVFVYFGSHLAALDLDGRLVWTQEVDPAYAEHSRYAAASSPILVGDTVVVAQDREWATGDDDVGWLAAYDKATGRRIWRREWTDTCCAYSTPLWVGMGDEKRLLFAHSGFVAEYDPGSGERLWSQRYKIGQIVSSPVVEGNLLCVAGGAHNVRRSTCATLEGRGRETRVEFLWQSQHGPPQTSSPVLYHGLLFTVTSQGILSCLDARTGKPLWTERLPRAGYHPSLLAGDGKVYVVNTKGVTSVVAAAPEFRLISTNRLGDGGHASPAVARGSLVLRTRSQLVRIDKKTAAGS